MPSILVLGLVLLVLTVLLAPLARRYLVSKPPPSHRWQIFVPKAQVMVITRSLSSYDVEVRPYPVGLDRMDAIIIDTEAITFDFDRLRDSSFSFSSSLDRETSITVQGLPLYGPLFETLVGNHVQQIYRPFVFTGSVV